MSEESNEYKYMEFSLGNEQFSIPLLKVVEVIKVPETTHIPRTPEYFNGIMNLRGKVLTIIDLRMKFKIVPNLEKEEEAVIILNIGELNLGIIVDSINRVVTKLPDELQTIPDLDSKVNLEYIEKIYHHASEPILILNISKALDLHDFEVIETQSKMAE